MAVSGREEGWGLPWIDDHTVAVYDVDLMGPDGQFGWWGIIFFGLQGIGGAIASRRAFPGAGSLSGQGLCTFAPFQGQREQVNECCRGTFTTFRMEQQNSR